MQLKDLKENAKNPRKINEREQKAMAKSLAKFGDLSGFVVNRRTKNLISGHQKKKLSPANSKVVIEKKYDQPTKARTVADGYVEIEGERFKYREVDADEKWESEAMIAANKHTGRWDRDMLRMVLSDLPDLDLEATGFELGELRAMDIELPQLAPLTAPTIPMPTAYEAAVDDSPDYSNEHVDEEIPVGSDEDADAAYMRDNPGPDSGLAKENIPSMVNYGDVAEKIETKNELHLVTIHCTSKEQKEALREKLRAEGFESQHGVKVY